MKSKTGKWFITYFKKNNQIIEGSDSKENSLKDAVNYLKEYRNIEVNLNELETMECSEELYGDIQTIGVKNDEWKIVDGIACI